MARLTLSAVLACALIACGDKDGDDTGAHTGVTDDTGQEADDTGPEDPEDTGPEDPEDGEVSGAVVVSGGGIGDVRVQLCDTLCLETTTGADGTFTHTSLAAGSYKLDALGEFLDSSTNYGHIRAHVELSMSEIYAVPDSMRLPIVSDTEAFGGSGRQSLELDAGEAGGGKIQFTADPADLSVPFGFTEDYAAGVVTEVPALWGMDAELAVAFLPFATEVTGDVEVSFPAPEGVTGASWDVYDVGAKGELADSPSGSAVLSGDEIVITASPEYLSWLLLIPQ